MSEESEVGFYEFTVRFKLYWKCCGCVWVCVGVIRELGDEILPHLCGQCSIITYGNISISHGSFGSPYLWVKVNSYSLALSLTVHRFNKYYSEY